MSTNVTTTPDAALVELAQHDDHLVRAYAAGHPDTSIATLWMLATDESATVRSLVAGKFLTVSQTRLTEMFPDLPAQRAS